MIENHGRKPSQLRLRNRSYKLRDTPTQEMTLADPYRKPPSLIRPKSETPRLFVFVVLAIIAAMIAVGETGYPYWP